MENIHLWGLDLIHSLQSLKSPVLTGLMTGITWIGSPTTYLILILLIYWCINEKKGFTLGFTILISAWLNITLKFLFNQDRPYFTAYDPSVQLIPERLSGLPSGHAQNALVMWIIVASWINKKWAYITAVVLCLAISFSRLYLGVHFPSDILAGLICGGAVLCVYFLLGRKIEGLLEKSTDRIRAVSAALLSFLMILYRPGEEILIPGALLLGFSFGYILNRRYVHFESAVKTGYRPVIIYRIMAVRYILGITVAALIYVLFRKIIPLCSGTSFYIIAFFVQYVFIGLWVSAGAPWLLCILHLAQKQAKKENTSGSGHGEPGDIG